MARLKVITGVEAEPGCQATLKASSEQSISPAGISSSNADAAVLLEHIEMKQIEAVTANAL